MQGIEQVLMIESSPLSGLTRYWKWNFLICFILTAAGSHFVVLAVRTIAEKIEAEKALKIIGF